MTDGLLDSIIQLEKRIQAEVASEQARADEWQARELGSLESLLAAGRAAEEQRRHELFAARQVELQREGDALEESSSAWCDRLSNLDSATLSGVLQRHLAAILPGEDHDHPHGEG